MKEVILLNNKAFRLKKMTDYFNILNAVENEGLLVNGTKELTNVAIITNNTTASSFAESLDIIEESFLFKSAFDANDADRTFGPYNMKYYCYMNKELEHVGSILLNDICSRQGVAYFKELHCFLSIQFLVRDGKLVAIANMRSCNCVENLRMDTMITILFAYRVKAILSSKYEINDKIDVFMNIGSLHIFEQGE